MPTEISYIITQKANQREADTYVVHTLSVEEWFKALNDYRVKAGDKDGLGFVGATIRPGCTINSDNVTSVTVLGLDFDSKTEALGVEEILSKIHWRAFAYTTHSHTEQLPRLDRKSVV